MDINDQLRLIDAELRVVFEHLRQQPEFTWHESIGQYLDVGEYDLAFDGMLETTLGLVSPLPSEVRASLVRVGLLMQMEEELKIAGLLD